ncbi:MAG TPA: hypothetical protein EYH34_06240 [Planctomycetes bacterium]|nr:hypothetical protein [Planctomycetota bacterium]
MQSIETTFEEIREHLGFESTRGRCRKTALRGSPCPLGLYSIICCIYREHIEGKVPRPIHRACYGEGHVTFSDVIAEVRWLFWEETILARAPSAKAVQEIPRGVGEFLFDYLSQPA